MTHQKLIATLLLTITSYYSFAIDPTTTIEDNLNVQIITNDTLQSTWKEVDYTLVKDSIRINNYLKLLKTEYQKYPKDYLKKSAVDTIVICEKLSFKNTARAALPDPYKRILFLSIDTKYPTHYLIHVMHHELHHSTEYVLFGNMYHPWKKWNRKNKRKFKYGNGGIEAYKKNNKSVNYYGMIHPQKGFANIYSTMGAEEDRCELVSYLMNQKMTPVLIKYCKEDRLLKRKVKLIIRTLNKHSGTKLLSWREVKKAYY